MFDADKIKILTLNLYYKDKEKLDFYLMQVKLYIRKHSKQFENIENKVFFAFIYLRNDAFK